MIITLENCFFQISSYSPAYVRIIYEKMKGPVPLRPLLGKQNVQAKEVNVAIACMYKYYSRGRYSVHKRDTHRLAEGCKFWI